MTGRRCGPVGAGRLRLLHRSPRARTQSLDRRRPRLPPYHDWRQDNGFGVLELIMTAPMVVAGWIPCSTARPQWTTRSLAAATRRCTMWWARWACWKATAATCCVGLPWQSVHDGERYIHEPLRAPNVLIGTPIEAMNDIIARHEGVRKYLDNGWVHLFALAEDGTVSRRYVGDLRAGGRWRRMSHGRRELSSGQSLVELRQAPSSVRRAGWSRHRPVSSASAIESPTV
ncbi:MAG: putative inorganic carbon transporter subunit DabA [Caldilineaceae bacterium]